MPSKATTSTKVRQVLQALWDKLARLARKVSHRSLRVRQDQPVQQDLPLPDRPDLQEWPVPLRQRVPLGLRDRPVQQDQPDLRVQRQVLQDQLGQSARRLLALLDQRVPPDQAGPARQVLPLPDLQDPRDPRVLQVVLDRLARLAAPDRKVLP